MNTYCISVSENSVEVYSVLSTFESKTNDLKGVSNTPLHQTPTQEISKLPIQNFSDSNHKYFIIIKKIKKEKKNYPSIITINSKYDNNSTKKLITKNTEHIIDDITKLRLWAFVPLEQCSVLCV